MSALRMAYFILTLAFIFRRAGRISGVSGAQVVVPVRKIRARQRPTGASARRRDGAPRAARGRSPGLSDPPREGVIRKDDLMAADWGGRLPSESAVTTR